MMNQRACPTIIAILAVRIVFMTIQIILEIFLIMAIMQKSLLYGLKLRNLT